MPNATGKLEEGQHQERGIIKEDKTPERKTKQESEEMDDKKDSDVECVPVRIRNMDHEKRRYTKRLYASEFGH